MHFLEAVRVFREPTYTSSHHDYERQGSMLTSSDPLSAGWGQVFPSASTLLKGITQVAGLQSKRQTLEHSVLCDPCEP